MVNDDNGGDTNDVGEDFNNVDTNADNNDVGLLVESSDFEIQFSVEHQTLHADEKQSAFYFFSHFYD